ncbi:alpha-2-macroglobulin family protein [Hyphococcus luteus]|uniref:Alpha-2-macroglobulin n=1 Tax=Hyphococcus luteus TaxID=2058213 RepID=A0A2S7K8X4_9PROT|nr:alpha-2-macroglobulin [Marinicaulis flavus]PQA88909.1 alpha-2-macroglobulin [Marinicaulis flavus]
MFARRQGVLMAGGLLAAFALGILLGRTIAPDSGSRDAPNGQPVVSAETKGQTPRRPFQERRDEDAERPEEDIIKEFAYRRLRLDTGTETPKACLQFTRELDDGGDVNYGDFVRVSPADGAAIEVDGTSLCLSGLQFDKDYTVRLRAGLPSAKGERLERAAEVTVAFGDKPSYAGFAGDGVILPRLEADGIGIETVNVEKVEVTVYRVSDRSLARKNIVAGEASEEGRYSYVWDQEDGQDVGVKVFAGELATPGERNETTTTVFSLGAALGELKPGAYFIRLKDVSPGADENRAASAWRWIVFTDMALTTYSGADGVDVFVRSISTARAMAGVELTLIAANNDILATAITNGDGRARFEEEAVNGDYPLTPRMLMAYGPQEDYAALDLARAPLDLSDRDVGGRAAPPKVDAFVYLDRGIYRPGETVHVTGLLRDDAGRAIEERPLTVTVFRPNGTEADKRRITDLQVGGFSFDYNVPDSAARGMWRISVEADGIDNAVGGESFSVEDFVPQRLEVKLEGDEETPIRPGETRELSVDSRFLYGAPASGLAVEAEARLRLDPNPFPDFSAYRFGPVNGRFDERFLKLPNTTTDADGKASIAVNADSAPKNYGAPMRADVVVGVVEPGGRVVRESARIPVRPDDAYVGLKLANDSGSFGQDEEVAVDAVLLDWEGQPAEGELEWRLVEEDYWFDWYRQGGEWRWRRSYRDVLVAEGRGKTGAESFAKLVNQRVDPGTYRLTVSQAGGKAKSDIRFYVGWRSYAAGADSPDQAAITLQNDKVTPGSRARFFLNPPYEGEATVVIATDKVHLVQRMKVGADGREIIVNTDPSWGAGFYVMATVVTPRDPGERPVPRRAMAVTHVPFDMSARKLGVDIEDPEVFRPRQQLDLPVTVSNAAPGSTVMMTVAAVDEGILRLTKFKSPHPVDYYYGKKRLGVAVRDDYGRILHANLGAPARFGGDQLGGEGLTVVPTKSVALFTGPIKLDGSGKASVPIEVPDFNGELRLMAVAWSKDKLGSASDPLTVRDAVPAELALPRFLAPGDTATATLLIDNVDGAAGDYKVSLTGEGPVTLSTDRTFTLAQGEKQTETFSFETGEVGIGAVNLSVEGPGGFSVSRSYPIQSRTPYFPVTEVRTAALDPGETFQLTDAVTEPYVDGSADVTVAFSRLDGIEPGPLLDALYRYPYGCSEQLTSSAMPLLFVDVLGGEIGKGPERSVRPRVQKAVNELLNRQSPDGAFGLWRVGDRWASPWLGAYVTDFLYRAKAEGYGVPQAALDRAYASLADIARVDRWYLASYQTTVPEYEGNNDTRDYLRRRSAAYALYVLARAGRADLSDLRYFHDALLDETPSPLARAQIGAALAMMGDRARAESAFDKAMEATGWTNRGDYYQSALRDVAGLVALAVETGENDRTEDLVAQLETYMKDPKAMHTQEKAFTLLAAQALLRTSEAVALSVNGESLEDLPPAPSFSPALAAIEDGVSYRNDGEGQIFRSLTVTGSPSSAPPAAAQGFTLTKRIATRDGRPADLSAARQNDRFVVVISGAATDQRLHPAVIADLLPAGLEIETILNPDDAGGRNHNGPYKWIGELSYPKVAEARDDRFVAAIDVNGGNRFTLAYIVRAVTPGEFVMPGAVIEDMYRPGDFARTETGSVSIAAAE